MNLTFLGAGYVGLTSGAVFADLGNKVWVVRRSQDKVEMMKKGKVPFYEPGLDEVLARNVEAGRLIPTTSYEKSVPNSEVVFISVGTPISGDGGADLSQVKAAAKELAPFLRNEYTVIVDKSTVPPGTASLVTKIIEKENPQANFEVASCPEFLREGTALSDTQDPDRVVIGTPSDKAYGILEELHKPLGAPIVRTSVESAEIIKYAANAYLALRIGFIDQIANLCEEVGADVQDVIEGIGLDSRIGSHYWYPGIGYGGYCFPKDVAALGALFEQYVDDDNLFSKLDQYNRARPAKYVAKVTDALGGLENKKVAVLGLTAKPGTDDMRGSQAVPFIEALKEGGAEVSVYDPMGMPEAKKVLSEVNYAEDPYQAAAEADVIAVLCEWDEFEDLDWGKVCKKMNASLVFDAKRMFDPTELEDHGFEYLGVGV
ncbi:MAG: UDP-glucose/GDP-mannose dehydrogenase family protein [Patescibacteria group bacterium]|nr:UDP-glucose/GDP-mannose dehydrogenase family protein [Patescibacteria group bacterium]